MSNENSGRESPTNPLISRVEHLIDSFEYSDGITGDAVSEELGKIGKPALFPLINALHDQNSTVRWRAAEVLGRIGDSRAVKPLIEALEDEDGYVRSWAASALGVLSDRRALKPLIEALKDQDSNVRGNAAVSLGLLRDSQATESLLTALQDTSSDVRSQAAIALGNCGDARAIGILSIIAGRVNAGDDQIQ